MDMAPCLWGGFPFAILTSLSRHSVTICSGWYLWMGMTRSSSKWILSRSTWYKFLRSRQPHPLAFDVAVGNS
jgi:hypothetical protein